MEASGQKQRGTVVSLNRDECLVALGVHAALHILVQEARDECDVADFDDYTVAEQALERIAQRYKSRLTTDDKAREDA